MTNFMIFSLFERSTGYFQYEGVSLVMGHTFGRKTIQPNDNYFVRISIQGTHNQV